MILRAREGSNFLPLRRFVTYENVEFSNWKRFYLLHLSFAVFRTKPMCWVDGRVMGSQTTDSLESQNSVVGAQERRKGEGLWARPRVKTGPRSASDATAFFNSTKNTSLWRSFGEEGLERTQTRQLSRMLIARARPLRIMKIVLVPGFESTRIFFLLTTPCRLANSYGFSKQHTTYIFRVQQSKKKSLNQSTQPNIPEYLNLIVCGYQLHQPKISVAWLILFCICQVQISKPLFRLPKPP